MPGAVPIDSRFTKRQSLIPVVIKHLKFLFGLALFAGEVRAADLVWTNTAGGNWGTAANWSPNQVPGSTDNAFITTAGTYTVTVNAGATVASLQAGGGSGSRTLALSSTLTVNGDSLLDTNCTFTITSGALTGAGSTSSGTRPGPTGESRAISIA